MRIHVISREFLNDFFAIPELGVKEYNKQQTRETWQAIIRYFKEAQDRVLLSNTEALSMFKSPHKMIMEITNL